MPGRDFNFIVEIRGVINISSGECFVFKQRSKGLALCQIEIITS